MKDKLFFIGKVFAIITIFLCLNVYYFIFFSSSFIIALILIWLSKAKIKSKIIWSIIPIIGGFLFMSSVQYFHHEKLKNNSLKVDYILPEDFSGEIIVYDNIDCGQIEHLKNDRLIINVPENGVVYYSGDLTNKGYIDNIFKRKNGETYEVLKNLNDAMFWDETKKHYEQNYTNKTIGVFEVTHYDYKNENRNFKNLFIVTNKNSIDSVNWYSIINKKLKNVNLNECD